MTDREMCLAVAELQSTPELSPINLNEFLAAAYSKEFKVRYEWIEKLARFVGVNKEVRRGHGKLLAKILRLSGVAEARRSSWTSIHVPTMDRLYFALEDVVEAFIDNSAPLRCGHFLEVIDAALESARRSYSSLILLERARAIIVHTIKQLSSRTRRRACFETQFNTFKALMQIGVRIVGFRLEHKFGDHKCFNLKLFEDGGTGALLTNALMAICQPFSPQEWENITSDQVFCNAIIKLNDTRKSAPGALSGLPVVVDLIRKPPYSSPGKGATSVGMVDVIDLSAD
jgi:hypothetical protein